MTSHDEYTRAELATFEADQRAMVADFRAAVRPGRCVRCGAVFATVAGRRYCSHACRQAAYRARHA